MVSAKASHPDYPVTLSGPCGAGSEARLSAGAQCVGFCGQHFDQPAQQGMAQALSANGARWWLTKIGMVSAQASHPDSPVTLSGLCGAGSDARLSAGAQCVWFCGQHFDQPAQQGMAQALSANGARWWLMENQGGFRRNPLTASPVSLGGSCVTAC
jgi:hypothetical protein